MTYTTVEPGSGADRFVQHLAANKGTQLDRHGAARLLGISAVAVDSALRPGVEAGLITVAADGDMGRVWRAGPNLKLAVAPGATQTFPAPKPERRGGHRLRLPTLATTGLAAKQMPLPDTELSAKGRTRYDHIFDMLGADGQAVPGIPLAYRAALQKAAQTYMGNRPTLKAKSVLTVRRIDAGTCGVWRLPRLDTSPASHTARLETK